MNIQDLDYEALKEMIKNDTFDDFIMQLLQEYEALGPLPGILLPLLEAILPFLPLFIFVVGNSIAYGLLKGFLFSWFGAVLGAVFVFWVIRRLGEKKFFQFIRRNKQVQRVTSWLERHGFGPLFLLMCFPFSPSAIINVVGALSKISFQQFVLAVVMGKAVMIFTISYVGHSITEFAQKPLKTIVVGICIAIFWVIGKVIERKLQQRSHENVSAND
ncbi:TVP38/TMEM64 family protein [Pontibacillus salipaludis]|uniref:TVP38/TMEM64 family membrane protein n=1 Tax=Pontibacillus salipaludis TaxID=1697394 RepID=A0ABQ1QDS0_9BACI|nr:TVP38/TMEM64 family protein [Pontibacillus salipaludis]GGD24164.1 alkaline phosphatase [Pontibacillus salipaludis]